MIYIVIAFLSMLSINAAMAQADPVADLPALPSFAQKDILPEPELLPMVRMFKHTHPEDILFAQLKLSGAEADIDKYARQSPFFLKAQDIDKQAVLLSEYNRIANAFSLYDAKKEIVVYIPIKADSYSSLQNIMVFDEFHDKAFFRYKIYNDHIGIVPENIKKFSVLEFSKPRAEKLFETTEFDTVIAEIILKPVYADRKEPYTVDETDYWLMFARIGEIRLWSSAEKEDRELLWYHRADWYSPEDTENLGGLYVEE